MKKPSCSVQQSLRNYEPVAFEEPIVFLVNSLVQDGHSCMMKHCLLLLLDVRGLQPTRNDRKTLIPLCCTLLHHHILGSCSPGEPASANLSRVTFRRMSASLAGPYTFRCSVWQHQVENEEILKVWDLPICLSHSATHQQGLGR